MSLPRDTLINGSYTVPKLNSVYAANNGGSEGIEMLLTRVGEIIGFRPDGYMLIELSAFVDLVTSWAASPSTCRWTCTITTPARISILI